MSAAVASIYAWSAYALVVGASLVLIPNAILGLLGVAETEEVWIRVVGLVAIVLSLYYWDAARNMARHYFWASVLGRFFFAFSLLALVIGGAPWQLLLFGIIEIAGAVWTFLGLRSG